MKITMEHNCLRKPGRIRTEIMFHSCDFLRVIVIVTMLVSMSLRTWMHAFDVRKDERIVVLACDWVGYM